MSNERLKDAMGYSSASGGSLKATPLAEKTHQRLLENATHGLLTWAGDRIVPNCARACRTEARVSCIRPPELGDGNYRPPKLKLADLDASPGCSNPKVAYLATGESEAPQGRPGSTETTETTQLPNWRLFACPRCGKAHNLQQCPRCQEEAG